MSSAYSFPTILVAEDQCVGDSLVRDLQHEGYFVLVAHDGFEAIEIARVHSRPIHVMLTADTADGRALATELKQYRPHIQVLFITQYTRANDPDSIPPVAALAKVREVVKPPGQAADNEKRSAETKPLVSRAGMG